MVSGVNKATAEDVISSNFFRLKTTVTPMKNKLRKMFMILPLLAITGCLWIKPVEVKPIHITMDVNIKIDRELDSFFNDLDAKPVAAKAPATTPAKEESK